MHMYCMASTLTVGVLLQTRGAAVIVVILNVNEACSSGQLMGYNHMMLHATHSMYRVHADN